MAESMWELELEAQQDALAERKAMLVAKARQAAQQLGIYSPSGGVDVTQPQNYRSAVTGAEMLAPTVRRPALASAVGLIGESRDAYDRGQLAQDISQYRQREQADALQRVQAMPQGTPGGAPLQGPTPDGSQLRTVDQPADLRDQLAWAMSLQGNPRTAPIGAKFMEDQLINAPDRATKLAFEQAKFAEEKKHHRALEEKSAVTSPQYNSVFDASGKPTGTFDTKAGVFYDISGNPASVKPGYTMGVEGSDRLRQPVPTTAAGTSAAAAPATAATPPATSTVRGPGSGEFQKTTSETTEKVRNIDTATSLVNKAFPYLQKSESGAPGMIKEYWDRLRGTQGGVADSHFQLDRIAETLKPYYDRPPGDPTGAEVKAWGTAMAGLNDRTQHPATRAVAAVELLNQMAEQKARLTGTTPPPPIEVPAWARTAGKATPPADTGAKAPEDAKARIYMERWQAETPDRKGLIEQQMLSQGVVLMGRKYLGGDPTSPSSWGARK